MTTKIKWRLANRPTPDEVAHLHDKGLLTKDEAREILFSQETDEDRDKVSLQEEIKFLRQLVEKLSNHTEIVRQIQYIEKPYRRYDWYEPYKYYCSADTNAIYSTSTLTSGTNTINLMSASSDATTANAGYTMSSTQQSEPSFSSIKTF